MSFSSMLIHSAVVTRPTVSAGEMGETVQRFATVYAALPCRVVESSMSESIIAKRIGQVVTFGLLFGTEYTLREDDRVTVNGQEYEIQSLLLKSDSTGPHHWEASMEHYQ